MIVFLLKEKKTHESVFKFARCFALQSFEAEIFPVAWEAHSESKDYRYLGEKGGLFKEGGGKNLFLPPAE